MKKIFTACLLLLSAFGFAQKNVNFNSTVSYAGIKLSNLWGYVDDTGIEYALVGAQNGLSIVDVSNPASAVKKFLIPGPNSIWREIKTYKKFAYVVTEGGGGLQIVDLSQLPASVNSKTWKIDLNMPDSLKNIHALHVDTVKGYLYLYGTNLFGGAPVILNISDPWNPSFAGTYINGPYPSSYVHDGYADNDTLYSCHIYQGTVNIVDMRDKNNPVLLASQTTPNQFTHNSWLSLNRKTVFTTDEEDNSFLTAYDISDLSDIKELDRFQCTPGSMSIPHNTYILNDYAITSWYTDGYRIVDAHKPDNLVEVGYFDTYIGSGSGYNGCWGVYPFLPSGTIISSNILGTATTANNNGVLYITKPTYVRACYLEGTVTDQSNSAPLSNVLVEILSTSTTKNSKINGDYKTGYADAGTYSVRFSKSGYVTQTIANVSLTNGQITNLNVQLVPISTGLSSPDFRTFKISSNPFSESATLSCDSFIKEITITDILGKTVFHQNFNSEKLNLTFGENLNSGIYLLRAESINGNRITVKLIKGK